MSQFKLSFCAFPFMILRPLHSNMSQFKHLFTSLQYFPNVLYIPICLNLNTAFQTPLQYREVLYIPICLNLNRLHQRIVLQAIPSLHSNMSQFKLSSNRSTTLSTSSLHSNMSQFKPHRGTIHCPFCSDFTFQYVSI